MHTLEKLSRPEDGRVAQPKHVVCNYMTWYIWKWFGLVSFASFITFRLNINNCYLNTFSSYVIHHYHLLGSYLSGAVVPPMDSRLHGSLATVAAPYAAEHSTVCNGFLSTNCRWPAKNIRWFNTVFPQESSGPSLPTLIASTVRFLSTHFNHQDLEMMQQLVSGTHDYSHLVVQRCTVTKLSDDNLYDLTACYLLQKQPLSK